MNILYKASSVVVIQSLKELIQQRPCNSRRSRKNGTSFLSLEDGKKKYNPEWNKKRKIITVSFNDKEMKLFEKKYGDILSGFVLKEIAFKNNVTIRHFIHDKTKSELLFQLKKIGNNLNQIAWKVQINPNHISGLENQLKEVEKVLKKVEDLF